MQTPISNVTIFVSLHPWCRDEARDAAVRAAEDGRQGWLPTLGEAIGMLPKSDSATSGVEHKNKGDDMAADGLRTERVTLEVTHDLDARLSDWIVEVIDESLGLMESVRVVGDDDREGELATCRVLREACRERAAERDAAIRERDALKAERITQSLTADRFASAVAEADELRARVAELEAASGSGGSTPPEVVLPLVAGWAVTGHALVRRVEVREALLAAGLAVKDGQKPELPTG